MIQTEPLDLRVQGFNSFYLMRDFTEYEKKVMAECQRIKESATQTLRLPYPVLPQELIHRTERLWTVAHNTQEKILESIKQ